MMAKYGIVELIAIGLFLSMIGTWAGIFTH